MSLTNAMEEAYAANTHENVILETIELDHVTFDTPARFVSGVDAAIDLPLTLGGDPVTFTPVSFSAVLPGDGEGGPTPMRLRVSDVTGQLTPYLELAVGSTTPIEITYRAYTTGDLTQPGDVISRLYLSEVEQNADGVEGSISFQEIELQAFPLATYDEEFYPMLQNP
jgi:hypothetical protein